MNDQQQEVGHRISRFLIDLIEHQKYLQSEITEWIETATAKSESSKMAGSSHSQTLGNKKSSGSAMVDFEGLAQFLKLIFNIFDDFYGPPRKGLEQNETDLG